jgi:AcrR family transcriptional regulator
MTETTAVRKRSSTGSRERLLKAASELFAQRGYEKTTVRDIGQQAEVDPTMIARYFGGKAQLYLAALRRDTSPLGEPPADLTTTDGLLRLLERVGVRGSTPTLHAAVRPHEDQELHAAAMENLQARIVGPSEHKARAAGHPDAQLRAEIVTAALAGVMMSRTSGAFQTLGQAPSADVAVLLSELLSSLLRAS